MMKKICCTKVVIILSSVLLLGGCMTQQYDRGVSSNLVNYLYPEGDMISHKDDAMPVLQLPLRVGIAFIPESKHDRDFSLTEVEKQNLLETVSKKFESDPSVSHIQIIPEIYLKQGRGFITVEQVADLYDVDVIALVSYEQVAINELNDLALGYWTIVGALVLPGESTEFQTFVDTAVFDVKTRKLLFRAPGMHSASRTHTAFGFEKRNRKLRTKSFQIASNNMTNNLSNELVKFKARVKKGEVIKVKYRKDFNFGSGGGGSAGWLGLLGLVLLIRFSRIKND